jgi:DNA polymerase I-like protein with 3'-5' exonuclease and polymerase domains
MRVIAFDTETHLIKPGCIAPRMVCLTYTYESNGQIEKGILEREVGLDWFAIQITSPNVRLVGHHIFYDLGVIAAERPSLIPAIFRAIDEGRVTDTKIRQQMIDNARGELKFIEDEEGNLRGQDFSLAALVKRHLKKWISKGADTYRLRYNELDGVPLRDWPEAATKYAIDDAVYTLQVYYCQENDDSGSVDPREIGQIQAAWALYLIGMWGIRTDKAAVLKLQKKLQAELEALKAQLIPTGFIREIGSRDMKAIKARVVECYELLGKPVPLTEGGDISTSRDTFGRSGDPYLKLVGEYVHVGKLLTTYVPVLLLGTEVPINATYNAILETYRTSCSRPNMQNPPRKGGVRECFVARPGCVFVTADFDTLEMRTLAQNCLDILGYSTMADALREGRDLHLDLAAELLGISYEEAERRYLDGDPEVEEARQFCKIPNFGCPGGLSWQTLIDYARTAFGKEISAELAKRLHGMFRTRWREMPDYFQHAKNLSGPDVAERVIFPRSGLIRGKVPYTAICNGYFQHLAAMGAKDALYHVQVECFTNPKSPLYGCRVVAFLHDEIMLECVEARAAAAAVRLREIMVERMSVWCPDVPIKASEVMFRRWFKGAKAVRRDGKLVPSKPVEIDGKTKWIEDVQEMAVAA